MSRCAKCGRPESDRWPYDDGTCGVKAGTNRRILQYYLRATEEECAVAAGDGRRHLAATLRGVLRWVPDGTVKHESQDLLDAVGGDPE